MNCINISYLDRNLWTVEVVAKQKFSSSLGANTNFLNFASLRFTPSGAKVGAKRSNTRCYFTENLNDQNSFFTFLCFASICSACSLLCLLFALLCFAQNCSKFASLLASLRFATTSTFQWPVNADCGQKTHVLRYVKRGHVQYVSRSSRFILRT